MSIRQTYRTAIIATCWQAAGSTLLTLIAILLVSNNDHGRLHLGSDLAIEGIETASHLLNMYYRLTAADVAVLLLILAASMEKIMKASYEFRRAIQAAHPDRLSSVLERISTLCVASIVVCALALCFPPEKLLDMAKRDDALATLIFFWPMLLTVLMAFHSCVLLGALNAQLHF